MKKLILRALNALGYTVVRLPHKHARNDAPVAAIADTADSPSERLARDGYAVLRAAIQPDWMAQYAEQVRQWFDDLDRRVAAGEHTRFLDTFRRQSGMSLSPEADAESRAPAGVRDFLYRLKEGGAWDGFTSEPLVALIEYCSIRRQNPDELGKAFNFHQDGPVVYGSAPPKDGLVFWIPLTPIDSQTPGLEIIAGHHGYVPHSANRTNAYLEAAEKIDGPRIISSGLSLGDVLVFSLDTPHRTHLMAGMTKTRFSIDLRAVPLSNVPEDYKGLAIIPR